MRFAIITNPASGRTSVDQKRAALAEPAAILEAEIHGLDTTSAAELGLCARELATRCEVLVVAGGDGTFSDVINAVETSQSPVAFLPLGTGNAMQYALGYRGNLAAVAQRIAAGELRAYDLVDCGGGKRAFMASVGIEGAIIRLRSEYLARGASGFSAYSRAVFQGFSRGYQPAPATVAVDGNTFEVQNLLSLLVVKQPYYGFGMKMVPRALFGDGQLHILCLRSGLLRAAFGMATAFTIGNRAGAYCTGQQVVVWTEYPVALQTDGNYAGEGEGFTFGILPGALKIRC